MNEKAALEAVFLASSKFRSKLHMWWCLHGGTSHNIISNLWGKLTDLLQTVGSLEGFAWKPRGQGDPGILHQPPPQPLLSRRGLSICHVSVSVSTSVLPSPPPPSDPGDLETAWGPGPGEWEAQVGGWREEPRLWGWIKCNLRSNLFQLCQAGPGSIAPECRFSSESLDVYHRGVS